MAILVNHDFGNADSANTLLLKVDDEGIIINTVIINFGWFEEAGEIIRTNDGGIAVSMIRSQGTADYYGEGLLVKYNANLQEEWSIEVFNDQAVQSVVQLADGNYVVCGSHKFANGEVDATIAKIGVVQGEPQILWNRYYGGSWSDYFFDLTKSPDGGFAMVGRLDSLSVDTAYMYMVKTNCMGLLTFPEASFTYVPQGSEAVSFSNQSQFVYPDSIDGGHYLWNFGDGTSSTEVNPSHTYPQSGSYNVTLTAVVCNDTSVVEQGVVFAVGIQEPNRKAFVHIIPNPATTQATLHYQLPQVGKTGEVKLYDLFGREQLTTTLPAGGQQVLHLSTLPTGLYVYQVSQNGLLVGSGKLVKQ